MGQTIAVPAFAGDFHAVLQQGAGPGEGYNPAFSSERPPEALL